MVGSSFFLILVFLIGYYFGGEGNELKSKNYYYLKNKDSLNIDIVESPFRASLSYEVNSRQNIVGLSDSITSIYNVGLNNKLSLGRAIKMANNVFESICLDAFFNVTSTTSYSFSGSIKEYLWDSGKKGYLFRIKYDTLTLLPYSFKGVIFPKFYFGKNDEINIWFPKPPGFTVNHQVEYWKGSKKFLSDISNEEFCKYNSEVKSGFLYLNIINNNNEDKYTFRCRIPSGNDYLENETIEVIELKN